MSDIEARYDIFEPGDLTALVCVEQPDSQQRIVNALTGLDYKVHTGLFAEDIALKLKTHPYEVIFFDENFNGQPVSQNPVLAEIIQLLPNQRRQQFVVMVGSSVMTNDEMSAFIYSVDLVFNFGDLANLKPVLRRGVTRQKEFYHTFKDNLKQLGLV